MRKTLAPLAAMLVLALPGSGFAQSDSSHTNIAHTMGHSAHMNPQTPTETGQSAFAAIAEIINLLSADPETDWDDVDIDALRAHLVDMDAVTLHASVATTDTEGGAIFDVTSPDPKVAGSIRRMILAHGQTMSGADGMDMSSEKTTDGARMIVTGPDVVQIRALGFFGIMTLGMHHQAHHMALALGANPHQN